MNSRRLSNCYSTIYVNYNFFFIKEKLYAIHFINIIENFILLTQYLIHDDLTLNYLKNALFQINILKNVFREHKFLNKKTKKKHFNIIKFHMISHFRESIKLYNIIDNFNTKHIELKHIKVKEYSNQTNKRNI